MKLEAFVLRLFSIGCCVNEVIGTSVRASSKAEAKAKKRYMDLNEDAYQGAYQGGYQGGYQPQPQMMQNYAEMPPPGAAPMYNSRMQPSFNGAPNGESFLGVAAQAAQGQGQGDTTALVSRLSDAVEAQSKAMMMLENEVEQITAREVAFERKEDARWRSMATEACSSYSKNSVGPVTDESSCKDACVTGEGLKGGSWKSGSSSCSCRVKTSSYRTICGTSGLSISLLATLGMLTFFLRL
jgi:hypothetical protein